MAGFLHKLIFGFNQPNFKVKERAIAKRLANIRGIWLNTNHQDIGIERILRLILATSPFLFPGTYLKDFAGRFGSLYEDLVIDFYVLLKLVLPMLCLFLGWGNVDFWGVHPFLALTIWMLVETQLYIPTLVFAGDLYRKPRSYRRSVILVVLNYFEIVLDFAVLYYYCVQFNTPFHGPLDAIYFSFVTSASIGFGDYFPVDTLGRILVVFQSVIFLLLIILFLNFFTSKVEQKGYFGAQREGDDQFLG